MRDLNLSQENLSVQWQYVKRNLKDSGIITHKTLEEDIRHVIQNILQRSIDVEFEQRLGAGLYERADTRQDVRCGYYTRTLTTTFGQ